MISAFGVEHGESISKRDMVVRMTPTTKKEQRRERRTSAASGAIVGGALSGGATGLLNTGRSGAGRAALGAGGIGAALGGTLGASQRPRKYKAKTVAAVSKREKDPARENKAFGDPVKTAAVAGALGAAVLPRKGYNTVGSKIGGAAIQRGQWSAGRAQNMKNTRMAGARKKYASGLKSTGRGIRRSDDIKEILGRTAVGSATGAAAGGTVYSRRRLTPKESR